MKPEPTVYVVDDDPQIVEAITQLVELIDLKAESYTSAERFLQAYQPAGPGCLVLDVRMPGMSGLDLQKELAKSRYELPIVIITGHGDVRMAVQAMKLGALEFLEKPFRMQELCESIQQAIRLDEQRWQRQEQRQDADRRIGDLTPAERQVMELVAAGKTNKTIAEELGLSVRAVEDRRARMMRKLGVKSRAGLLELALAAELV
jgi:RNA polymerase sigma factor (sigma-70 family)